ncbi:GGDEF domain-containing protein [Deinococcus apachensis]|uniref:GGDEF domain-containing protein n=1 Tax=Deinococcus apachensis TaxID=309886 RepID=UPI00039EE1C6|nr:GGDEF domain-containing protein [Deinococcus apachensis]
MTPGPLRPEDLPAPVTRLYFGAVVPLIAAILVWGAVVPLADLSVPTLVFAALLLLTAAAYLLLPRRWEWPLRLIAAGTQVLFVAALALLGLGVRGDEQALHTLLLVAPFTQLVWSLLFFDRPTVGRALGLALAVAATLLVIRWDHTSPQPEPGTAPLLLAVCLMAQVFGWAFVNLQRRVIAGERTARRDPLTGLLNRRAFEEASAAPGPPGVLAVLDIDHFKVVNDRHGHETGDNVLRAVAEVLVTLVDPYGQVYRWGGEEFVVCLPGAYAPSAHLLMGRVRREVAGRTLVDGPAVTLSIGLGAYAVGQSPRQAFASADTALLAAKNAGRNRIVTAPAT